MQSILHKTTEAERDVILSVLPDVNRGRCKYIEPYFTTGDIMFAIEPERFYILCCDMFLKDMYQAIAYKPDIFRQTLHRLQDVYISDADDDTAYYNVRDRMNVSLAEHNINAEVAASMMFVTRASLTQKFPDMWGEYSEPCGPRTGQVLIDEADITAMWELFKKNSLLDSFGMMPVSVSDIGKTLRPGDLIFIDARNKDIEQKELVRWFALSKSAVNSLAYVVIVLPDNMLLTGEFKRMTKVKDGVRILSNTTLVDKAFVSAEEERRKVVDSKLKLLRECGVNNPFDEAKLKRMYDLREVSDTMLDAMVRSKFK